MSFRTAAAHSVAALFLSVLILTHAAFAQTTPTVIDEWLVLGPVSVPLPAFGAADASSLNQRLLDLGPVGEADWRPAPGESVAWDDARQLSWRQGSGAITLESPGSGAAGLAWVATYIEVDRWQKARLVLETQQPARLFVDGRSIATKSSTEDAEDETGRISEEVEFVTGKHVLLVKTLLPPDASRWTLSARLEPVDPEDSGTIRISTSPLRFVSMTDITDAPAPTAVSVAPSGDLVAVTITTRTGPDGDTDARIEVRSAHDGSLLRTYSGGMDIGRIEWAPTGRRFTYVDRDGDVSDLWMVDLDAGTQERLLNEVENLGSHRWAPDGSFIIFSATEKAATTDTGVRRMEYLQSRRPGFSDVSRLFRLSLPQKTVRQLTAGELSASLLDIAPDSRRILVSRSHVRYDERPFGVSEYSLIDLATLAVNSLFTLAFSGGAQFSPDGSRILITGGPSAFGSAGMNVPEGTVPNDYDTQAYVYDLAGGDVHAITRDFDPTVSEIVWDGTGRAMYLSTTDASFGRMYRYDLATKQFEQLPVEGDVVSQVSVAARAPVAAYISSGTSSPPRAWLLKLDSESSVALADPAAEAYRHVRFGEVRDWSFTNDRGVEIDGHVYYPPDFDERRTYPVIVYYYGGTAPVTRDFAGRYPKELWAAQGYLVYVLQPSGAVGYGQEFSALHVNDWGDIVADEIIDGVGQFLAAHPYAAADKVGAIGASFGGFMTMLLQTRTDMFAAAVSHAGISNIASYWGEGFWGFQYSAVATADSYPWNRPDVYVDRSPLYAADRITTPLLLLHGASDTNVPPGESLQMFTALKLLGREVEYVEVADQDHHILDYAKRIVWTNTILAWFDRWLKDQPEWWEAMF